MSVELSPVVAAFLELKSSPDSASDCSSSFQSDSNVRSPPLSVCV